MYYLPAHAKQLLDFLPKPLIQRVDIRVEVDVNRS